MPIIIIVAIVALLIALAAYAFISQSIEKKRVQKQRILMTLKTKHRNFVHLISGFPANFLPSDLVGLIYRALIDTSEQLCKIEPKDQRHKDDVTLYSNQLASLSKNNAAQRTRIDNPQAMKDVRHHLQELQRFIAQQEATKTISKVQFAAYSDQIDRLLLQMSVDTHIIQAKQAQQAGKLRLAIHFFTLANKLLTTENSTRIYDKQIAQLNDTIQKLEEKALASGEMQEAAPDTPTSTPNDKEWANFTPQEDKWKKKQIYD